MEVEVGERWPVVACGRPLPWRKARCGCEATTEDSSSYLSVLLPGVLDCVRSPSRKRTCAREDETA